jgi:phospholipid-translocating ATPase
VEDELADYAQDTLEKLRIAGIKVWMLTGDKIETACCIATSVGLCAPDEEMFTIAGTTDEHTIDNLLERFSSMTEEGVLVIDGQSLSVIINQNSNLSKLNNLQSKFLKCATEARSVAVCRCSPLQKA